MSRRKQSNPKPCKHHSEGEDDEDENRADQLSAAGIENERQTPSTADNSRLTPDGGSPGGLHIDARTPTPEGKPLKKEYDNENDNNATGGDEQNYEFQRSPPDGEHIAAAGGVTATFHNRVIRGEERRDSSSPPDPAMFVSAEIKSEPTSPPEGGSTSPRAAKKSKPTTPVVSTGAPFVIVPALQRRGMLCSCGINFSSLSTLAAHQKYYCTNRPNADDTPEPVVGGTEPVVSPDPAECVTSEATTPTPSVAADTPTVTTKKRIFACPQCAFTTDKANGLNRHMRIHVPPAGTAGDKERVDERYCRNCDIQFSSMKTYYVHKQYYCQTRIGKAASAAAAAAAESEHAGTPGKDDIHPAQQHMIALPTTPVLLLPYQVLQGASLVPSPLPPGSQPTACIVLPDGAVKSLSRLVEKLTNSSEPAVSETLRPSMPSLLPFPISGLNAAAAAAAAAASGSSNLDWVPPYGKRSLHVEGESPLDLTNKRLKISSIDTDSEEETRDTHAVSHENRRTVSVSQAILDKPKAGNSGLTRSPRSESTNSARSTSSTTPTNEHEQMKSATPEPTFRITVKPPDTISEADSVTSRRSSETVTSRGPETTSETEVKTEDPVESASKSLVSAAPSISSLVNGASTSVLETWLTPGAVLPPMLVNQGPALCPDCGTMFYKQENFEVHRAHYCVKRVTPKKERASPATSPATDDSPIADTSRFQFHCTACGTRFTSPDTLHAHKAFYCTHREVGELPTLAPAAAVTAPMTAAAAEPGMKQSASQPRPILATGWKCPCCDVFSPTSAAAQKHLETHNNVRAFKCSLCGYKGNTLRGMRTHIRMHFSDKKSPELPEESFISCIVANSDEEDNGREDRTEKCPLCAFKSGNPETMLKHFALAHPRSKSRVSTAPSMIENKRRKSSGSPQRGSDTTNTGKVSEKCLFCSFYTDSPDIMLNHQLFRHPEQRAGSPAAAADPAGSLSRLVAQKIERRSSSSESHDAGSPVASRHAEDVSQSTGVELPKSKQNGSVAVNSTTPGTAQPESLLCHHCNIVFKQLASYAAHTQFYCPGRTVNAARSVTPVQ